MAWEVGCNAPLLHVTDGTSCNSEWEFLAKEGGEAIEEGVGANTRALDFLRNGIEFYRSALGWDQREKAIDGQVVRSTSPSLYRSLRCTEQSKRNAGGARGPPRQKGRAPRTELRDRLTPRPAPAHSEKRPVCTCFRRRC